MSALNLKNDFPFFESENKSLSYLDSAATALKPKVVIDAISNYYTNLGASVHRGAYRLGDKVTGLYESARKASQDFLGAKHLEEIIFTSGTTDALNLLASSLSDWCLKEGDEIVVTMSEHHANFVPWQQATLKHKCLFKVIPLTKDHKLDLEEAKKTYYPKDKNLSFFSHVQCSWVLKSHKRTY